MSDLLTPHYWDAGDHAKASRWDYWRKLMRVQIEFETTGLDRSLFSMWLTEQYGIKLNFNNDGNITDEMSVVDEQKYLLFELKYA